MKLEDLEVTIRDSLLEANVPKDAVASALKKVRAAFAEEKAARAPTDKSKNQFVVLVDDSEGVLAGKHLLGWVGQIEADAPPQVFLDRAKAAGRAFNESRKGSKRPVKNIREVFAGVPRKFWKDGIEGHKSLPKCKEPILLMATNGDLK